MLSSFSGNATGAPNPEEGDTCHLSFTGLGLRMLSWVDSSSAAQVQCYFRKEPEETAQDPHKYQVLWPTLLFWRRWSWRKCPKIALWGGLGALPLRSDSELRIPERLCSHALHGISVPWGRPSAHPGKKVQAPSVPGQRRAWSLRQPLLL